MTKKGGLSIVFLVQGTDGSPTGPELENRVGDQYIGSPVSSGLQVPGEPGHCCTNQDTLGELPMAFFLQLHRQK